VRGATLFHVRSEGGFERAIIRAFGRVRASFGEANGGFWASYNKD